MRISELLVFPAPMSNGAFEKIGQSVDESIRRGWDDEREGYTCWDGAHVHVSCRTASVRDLDEIKRAPRNKIIY